MILPQLVFSAVIMTGAAAEPAPQTEAYHHLLLARQALAASDYPTSIREYRTALAFDEKSVNLRVGLAELFLRLRRYRDAIREAEEARAIDPDNVDVLELLAATYGSTRQPEEALSALRDLIAASPENSAYVGQLASLLDTLGRHEESVKLLEEAVERNPGSTEAVEELVRRFRAMGRLDLAIKVLEDAAAADPSGLELRQHLANLYMQVQDVGRAVATLDEMVEIDPGNLKVLLQVASIHSELENHRRSLELHQRALLLQPDDSGIRLNVATGLTTVGRFADAVIEYRLLLKEIDEGSGGGDDTDRFQFLRRIGWLEQEIGNREQALQAFERARTYADPDDYGFIRMLARFYDLSKMPEKGLQVLDEAPGLAGNDSPEAVDLLLARACLLMLVGRVDEGVALYEKLHLEHELEVRHHGFVAQALFRSKRGAPAYDAIQRAIELQPERVERVHLYVAGLLFEVGEKELGFSVIERLTTIFPDDRGIYAAYARELNQRGEELRAIGVLKGVVDRFPDDADLRFQLGAALERQQEVEEAEATLEAAIKIDPEHAMALNYLAYTWAERNEKLERSLAYAKRAVKLEPNNGAFLDSLGWVYFKLGRLDEAFDYLDEAVKLIAGAGDPVVRGHLADVLAKRGEHGAAIDQYAKAIAHADPELRDELQEKLDLLKSATSAGAGN